MGNNNRKPSYFDIIYTISACIGVLVLIIGVAYNIPKEGQTENKAEDKKEYIVPDYPIVPIDQLIADYNANAIAADELYNGKIFSVTGVIVGFGTDVTGNKFVGIKSKKSESPFDYIVQCIFQSGYGSELARYSKGDVITITGECQGINPLYSRGIVMWGCK